jgi:hypothetical protein
LDDVKGALTNPKGHAEADLAASLERFGFTEPPLLDERTGRLVVGHGRLDALRARRDRGEEPPDGIVKRDGTWFVPVQRGWASSSDAEAQAYLLASNQLTTAGGWSDELGPMLDDLAAQGVSLDGLGWSDEDFDAMRRQREAAGVGEMDYAAEWDFAGMPGYASQSLAGAYSTAVHFRTEEDADEFFRTIDRPKARKMWWPQPDGFVGSLSEASITAEPVE